MNVKILKLEQELKSPKTPTIEHNIEASEDFKCDQYGYMCKREVTLRKHMNTKHQLNLEEANIVIENDSNCQIKELEDKIEHLALDKARVECEVGKLKTEKE